MGVLKMQRTRIEHVRDGRFSFVLSGDGEYDWRMDVTVCGRPMERRHFNAGSKTRAMDRFASFQREMRNRYNGQRKTDT